MFTGLIEGVGTVIDPPPGIVVRCAFARELRRGDSIAVDGACLTVEDVSGAASAVPAFSAHLSRETMDCSIAGSYRRGAVVNLERPVGIGDRLGGHMVTGHVDSVAAVARSSTRVSRGRKEIRHWIRFDERFDRLVVEKGSVALNGISLTVAGVDGCGLFHVVLIPETLSTTNSSSWRAGTRLNIEFDLLGKYVARHVGGGIFTGEEDDDPR